jgi:rusticyanin
MTRRRITVLISAVAVAAAGIGVGAAIAASGSGAQAPAATTAAAPGSPPYSYYRSTMSGYHGGPSMMGGSGNYQQVMGMTGYRWMFGGASAPGWMQGTGLPGSMQGTGMMGTGADPGKFMGQLWASAPGPRVSTGQAARLGSQIPAGARIDQAAKAITFSTATVRLVAVASPAGGPDETFRIAGLVNPAITVPAGAKVSIQVINADPDTAHGLVITTSQDISSPMPMMTSRPAFTGSAVWFLGNPTAAGMHTATLTFTATTPGTYHYLCPVPGHAQQGMTGTFTVSNPS